MDLVALRREIQEDPAGLSYAGKTDAEIADLLNAENRTGQAQSLDVDALVASIHLADIAVLNADQRFYLSLVCDRTSLPLVQPLKGQLRDIFPANSDTGKKFAKIQEKSTSRAAELGLGRVGDGHVKSARS